MTDNDRKLSRLMIKLRVMSTAMLISAPMFLFIARMHQGNGKWLNHTGWKIELMFYLILLYILATFLVLPRMERAQIKVYHKKQKHKKTVFRLAEEIQIIKASIPGASFTLGFVALFVTGDWWRLVPFYAIGLVGSVVLWPYKNKVMDTLKRIEAESL